MPIHPTKALAYELKSRVTEFNFFFFNDTATTEIYTLSLHDALPISIATPSPLPGVGVNIPYSFQFTNNGCSGPFTWSACSGLPPGLSLSSSGNLSGTPTVVGSNYF